MSRRAWANIWSVLVVAGVLVGLSLRDPAPAASQWLTLAGLTALATIAQFFEAEAPGFQWYYPTLVFLLAGLLLLPPFLFVLLVIIPHLVEWAKKRLTRSPRLRAWYVQPFNIAMHIIAGSAAHWVYTALVPGRALLRTPMALVAITAAALTYVIVNHILAGRHLVLARGVTWRESGVLGTENLLTDFVLLYLGFVVAVHWTLMPWLVLPALAPLVLMYRALSVPRLKREAQTDGKTGLWNARHFTSLFTVELERARRFQRPLTLIIADLDLLRNINNTYGHLAGDTVLAGISQIIRQTTRDYDIPARLGGEEFAIVLPEVELAEACVIAERLRQAIEATRFQVSTCPTPIQATMSLGIACFPSDGTQSTGLIHEADVAVYQAKLKGRNCVVCASDVPRTIKLELRQPADHSLDAYAFAHTPARSLWTVAEPAQ
ncbi:MAG: GGDEF domain-containing protein [Ardenticatenaceae bacterium]|nr:GGDEF domain-containing protein [Ardenticatenaceae bacterium]HBY94215.1 hypothetical protein [Chloroflexota bacterium]